MPIGPPDIYTQAILYFSYTKIFRLGSTQGLKGQPKPNPSMTLKGLYQAKLLGLPARLGPFSFDPSVEVAGPEPLYN